MTIQTRLLCAIAVSGFAAFAASAPAQALTTQECSAKYQAAKAAGTLGGQKWNDFRKAQCGADATAVTTTAAPAPAPAPVADPVLTPIQQEILNLQNQIKTAATKGDTATVNSLTAALNALQTANAPPPAVAPVAPVTPVATP